MHAVRLPNSSSLTVPSVNPSRSGGFHCGLCTVPKKCLRRSLASTNCLAAVGKSNPSVRSLWTLCGTTAATSIPPSFNSLYIYISYMFEHYAIGRWGAGTGGHGDIPCLASSHRLFPSLFPPLSLYHSSLVTSYLFLFALAFRFWEWPSIKKQPHSGGPLYIVTRTFPQWEGGRERAHKESTLRRRYGDRHRERTNTQKDREFRKQVLGTSCTIGLNNNIVVALE